MSSRFTLWLPDDLRAKLKLVGEKEGIRKLSIVIVMLLTRAVSAYELQGD